MTRRPFSRWRTTIFLFALVASSAFTRPASAQTLNSVLSFLLTNRSIQTDDFVRDQAAAVATRDAISTFLASQIGSLPVSSSSSGFTYRLEPELGTTLRSSESFGPFFTERSLTAGAHHISFGLSYQQAQYRDIDGRRLTDGTFVAIASRLTTETQPFDVETLTLRLSTDTVTLLANVGVTDRLDVAAAFPLVRVTLDGRRVDNYRGQQAVQAVASGTSTGPGDLILRAKYNIMRTGASGIALGAEARLPTGDAQNLLGTGKATIAPRAIVSLERGPAGLHGTASYVLGGLSHELDVTTAGTLAATHHLTLVGELATQRFSSIGRLVDTPALHPTLAGVETIRVTTTNAATTRVTMSAGLKWNLTGAWLLNVNVSRSLTQAGLDAGWLPALTFDRSIGF